MQNTKNNIDVLIIGAGLSGLSAAVNLHRMGKKILILEGSDRVGGRVKTDIVNGFRLDHGFQVLLTAYPEAKALLDYKALNLRRFLPGAEVLYDGGRFEIADPFRRPSVAFSTLFAPVGSLKDKVNTVLLKNRVLKTDIQDIFSQKEITTLIHLKNLGFSETMIERFFRPFFSGIFLENDLGTSNRMFDFVMKMFSEEDAAIPALGMEEIPKQLLAMLPANSVLYNEKVVDIDSNIAKTQNGNTYEAKKVIIATEATSLAKKYMVNQKPRFQSVTNIYFELDSDKNTKAQVILNASKERKWVNNLTFISAVSDKYAPTGKSLLTVSGNGLKDLSSEQLAENIKAEMQTWYGEAVGDWKFLKRYDIKYALPALTSMSDEYDTSKLKLSKDLYICGDHLLNGSINAAMKTGRLAAELIKSEL